MNNQNRPFDLGLLDFKARRLKKRHQLRRWSIIPMAIALLVAIIIALPPILTVVANNSYSQRQYDTSANLLRPIGLMNLANPEIYYFNFGTSLSQSGRYDDAINQFQSALAYSKDKSFTCHIINNLTLTSESAGLVAVSKQHLSDAVNYFTRALSNASANLNCFKDRSIITRLAQELLDAQTKNQATTGNQTQQTSTPPDQSQQQQIQQLQQKSVQNRSDDQSKSSNYSEDYSYKHW